MIAALQMLTERFRSADHDGPSAYAAFLAEPDDIDGNARLRNEAVAAVSQFLTAARAKVDTTTTAEHSSPSTSRPS